MTTKKISQGYYKGQYKNIDFKIVKVPSLPNNEVAWYWQIENEDVSDWFSSKKFAILAVKEYINATN